VLSDVLGRVVSLLDALLSERFSNTTSIRLMQRAATLDLEDFEDSELQDRLDRARRQTMGRTTLLSQIFGQAQDVVTIATFAAGLVVYAPWLIALLVIALVPAFLGEAHFNAQSYSSWSSPRARSRRRAPTGSCWRRAGATRSCSSCRPRGTGREPDRSARRHGRVRAVRGRLVGLAPGLVELQEMPARVLRGYARVLLGRQDLIAAHEERLGFLELA